MQGTRYEGGKRVDVEFKHGRARFAPTRRSRAWPSLKPAFSTRTARSRPGNSSPLSDGAAAALVMSKAKADALGVKPLGVLPRASRRSASTRPSWASGPSLPCASCSRSTGLTVGDIDLFEVNEAFAAQSVYVQRTLEHPGREAQRQRRRHRARPPARLHRGEAHGHGPARAASTRRPLRRRHDVHRRRHGGGGPLRDQEVTSEG